MESHDATPEELARLVEERDAAGCVQLLDAHGGADASRLIDRLSEEHRSRLLETLAPEYSAHLLRHLPESSAVDAIEDLPPEASARILEELPSDARADLVSELGDADAAAILGEMPTPEAEGLRQLSSYADDVAGGLMVTECLSYPQHFAVADILDDLDVHQDRYKGFDIQYIYVVDRGKRLVGVLRIRDLLLANRRAELESIMVGDPISVLDTTSLEELRILFQGRAFLGLPVTDSQRALLGVVQRSAVVEAMTDEAVATYRQSQGIVGGEELRSMPLRLRSRRRLAWLSINIVLNMIAASIIAMHQATLQQVIALAVFLPIISDMSGCSGNQAVAVSMRELTLGVIRPNELLRVLKKELSVGALNGLALGVLIGVVAYLWKGNEYLGVVVGTALTLNTVVAVSIGGCVPLILKGMKLDPALASGPILTTITDMCGFFFVLSFASIALDHLG